MTKDELINLKKETVEMAENLVVLMSHIVAIEDKSNQLSIVRMRAHEMSRSIRSMMDDIDRLQGINNSTTTQIKLPNYSC